MANPFYPTLLSTQKSAFIGCCAKHQRAGCLAMACFYLPKWLLLCLCLKCHPQSPLGMHPAIGYLWVSAAPSEICDYACSIKKLRTSLVCWFGCYREPISAVHYIRLLRCQQVRLSFNSCVCKASAQPY